MSTGDLTYPYEPDYHQFEFDVRLYLTQLELNGERLWGGD
jgi:hypothetical protein